MILFNLKMNIVEMSLKVMKKNAHMENLYQLMLYHQWIILTHQWIILIHRWITYQLIGHTSTIIHQLINLPSRNINSFSRSMNSGGAFQSQRSFTNQDIPINYQEASSSRSNLSPQRKWTKSHSFELIIGDAGDGGQNKKCYSK